MENQKAKIADVLSVSHLQKKQQEKIISLLAKSLGSKIIVAVWKRLSKEQKAEVGKILSKPSGNKKILDYLGSKIKNFNKLINNIARETVESFRGRQ